MKPLYIVTGLGLLLTLPGQAEETQEPTVRAKLLAKIIQSAPPLSAAAEGTAQAPAGKAEADDRVTMAPLVVLDDKIRQSDLGAAVLKKTQQLKAEQFSPVRGGSILKKDTGKVRWELGTWGAASGGLSIFKMSW